MDEKQQSQPGTGPAGEAGAEARDWPDVEATLEALSIKYRGKDFSDVEEDDRSHFAECWSDQHDRWAEPYSDFVEILNDINRWVAMRYKGVPDLIVAAAVSAAGAHLMNVTSHRQIQPRFTQGDLLQRLQNAVEVAGLAVSDPKGHG